MAAATDPSSPLILSGGNEVRTTRYSDVCGGTDELKRLLVEEPSAADTDEGRAALCHLVDDGIYMLARMEVRLREYQAFRDVLVQAAEQLQRVEEPRLADAHAEAEQLRALLDSGRSQAVADVIQRAEEIRQVANDMEGALRRHKEAAIEVGRAYLQLRGARGWDDGSASARASSSGTGSTSTAGGTEVSNERGDAGSTEALPPWIPEAWLPPAPHRAMIVDWLKRGRAALLSDQEAARYPEGPQGREPLVQFEDGGVMPLRVVRWSEEVRNFHPLGSTPHPRGRHYRKREAGLNGPVAAD